MAGSTIKSRVVLPKVEEYFEDKTAGQRVDKVLALLSHDLTTFHAAHDTLEDFLAPGAAGKVIRSDGTSWAGSTFTIADTFAAGSIPHASALNTVTALAIGAAGKLVRSTGTLPAYSTFTVPDTFAQGDLLHDSATNIVTALGVGAANRVLTSSGTLPQWSANIAYAALPTGGGTWANGGDLTVTGGLVDVTGGSVRGLTNMIVNGAAGTNRQFTWQTSGVTRWQFQTGSGAESGGNAGSNFNVVSFDDAGVSLGTAFAIDRVAGGRVLIASRPLFITGGDLRIDSTFKVRYDGLTAGDTYRTESSANVLDDYVGGVNVLRMTSSIISTLAGNSTIFGHTALFDTQPSVTPKTQVIGTDGLTSAAMAFVNFQANALGPRFAFAHSRGASIGTHALLAAADQIGGFDFSASDGTVFQQVAFIRAFASGAQSATSLGSFIGLATQAEGAVNLSREVVRVTAAGDLALRAASKLILSGLAGTTSYIYEVVPNVVVVNVSGNDVFLVRATAAEVAGDFVVGAGKKVLYDGSVSGDTYTTESSANVMQNYAGGNLMLTYSATQMGFFGHALASRQTYVLTNVTPDRTFDPTATTAAEVAMVLATFIQDMQSLGLAA